MKYASLMLALIMCVALGTAQAADVTSTSPTLNELDVSIGSDVSVTFDVAMDSSTFTADNFVVYAQSTGMHPGTIEYNSSTRTATLDPDDDFDYGELVEENTPEGFFNNPQHDRTRLFLSQILT